MSINELLAQASGKEMDRKDFLKLTIFMVAGLVGMKNLLTLMTGVDIRPDMTVGKRVDSSDAGVGYNSGRYNR